jgi:hypothetical protein
VRTALSRLERLDFIEDLQRILGVLDERENIL